MMNINELAVDIHESCKSAGWWDNPNRCVYECLQLVSTEIAEATEGERKDLMDDHLTHRKAGDVELADALIRILDLGGKYVWKYDQTLGYNHMIQPLASIGCQHLSCNMELIKLYEAIVGRDGLGKTLHYSRFINSLLKVAEINGYDIESAMMEKREYNKTREDHKRENRAKEGGKKF